MNWKKFFVSLLTFGLNLLISFLKEYNSSEKKLSRTNNRTEKKILKRNRRKKLWKGF